MNELNPAAIAVVKDTLTQLMKLHDPCISFLSLTEAVKWLELQLPALRDVTALLTWANAMEQVADALGGDQALWRQVLQTEGYTLRLRARDSSTSMPSYTPEKRG